jgi:hypothetical protein
LSYKIRGCLQRGDSDALILLLIGALPDGATAPVGDIIPAAGRVRALDHHHFAAPRIHLDVVAVAAFDRIQTSADTGTCDCPAGTSEAFPLLPLSAIKHGEWEFQNEHRPDEGKLEAVRRQGQGEVG